MRDRADGTPTRGGGARVAFASFGIEVSSAWPDGRDYAAHYPTLMLKGQTIAVSELGDTLSLAPTLRERLMMIRLWGHTDGDDGDNGPDYVVHGLVAAGSPELIRKLPELQRWVRASGKSVEQIAQGYAEIVKRNEEEQRRCQHL